MRRQRAAWLKQGGEEPSRAASGGQAPRLSSRATADSAPPGRTGHPGATRGADELGVFADKLREATAASQREREAERDRQMAKIRMQVLEEEIDGLAVALGELDTQLERAHRDEARVDVASEALDAEVEKFMRSVRQRKHALACEKATIAERMRVINEKRADNDAQVRLIQDTLLTLRQ